MAFNPLTSLRPQARIAETRQFTDAFTGQTFTLTFRRMNVPEIAFMSKAARDYISEFVPDENGKVKSALPVLPVPAGDPQPIANEDWVYQLCEIRGMQPDNAPEVYDFFELAAMSIGLDPDTWQSIVAFANEVTGAKKKQPTPLQIITNESSQPASDTQETTPQ